MSKQISTTSRAAALRQEWQWVTNRARNVALAEEAERHGEPVAWCEGVAMPPLEQLAAPRLLTEWVHDNWPLSDQRRIIESVPAVLDGLLARRARLDLGLEAEGTNHEIESLGAYLNKVECWYSRINEASRVAVAMLG